MHAFRHAVLLLPSILFVSCAQDPGTHSPFAGNWILELDDETLMVLSLAEDNEDDDVGENDDVRLTGTFLRPRSFEVSSDGILSGISSEEVTLDVQATFDGEATMDLTLTDGTRNETVVMELVEDDRAVVRPYGMPEWMKPLDFRRAVPGDPPKIEWTPPAVPPELAAVRDELLAMAEEDQAARSGAIVSSRISELRAAHRPAIERIHAEYGWPWASVFGWEAAQAFALLVQHQDTDLQERLLPDLEMAVARREASPQDLAMLEDELDARAGREQRWGTQVSCVDGEAVLDPVADPEGLAERRRGLYLPPIDEYLDLLRLQCANLVEDE